MSVHPRRFTLAQLHRARVDPVRRARGGDPALFRDGVSARRAVQARRASTMNVIHPVLLFSPSPRTTSSPARASPNALPRLRRRLQILRKIGYIPIGTGSLRLRWSSFPSHSSLCAASAAGRAPIPPCPLSPLAQRRLCTLSHSSPPRPAPVHGVEGRGTTPGWRRRRRGLRMKDGMRDEGRRDGVPGRRPALSHQGTETHRAPAALQGRAVHSSFGRGRIYPARAPPCTGHRGRPARGSGGA
ncbi:hypothetical protein DFH09DRAFT_69531 [Mycena vulgaris]|nr:hypothetical protein DFH09DRAFT_69531 [Mycena vulgaris]